MYVDASSPSIDSLLNQLFQPSTSCVQDQDDKERGVHIEIEVSSTGVRRLIHCDDFKDSYRSREEQ
jgi:hypothetical protein